MDDDLYRWYDTRSTAGSTGGDGNYATWSYEIGFNVVSTNDDDTNGDTIPEPATLALMGLGLAGIGYRSKKAT